MILFQTYQNSIAAMPSIQESNPFSSWSDCGSFTDGEIFDGFGKDYCDFGDEIVSKI